MRSINDREFARKSFLSGEVMGGVYAGGVVASPLAGTIGCFALRNGHEVASCLVAVGTEEMIIRFKREHLAAGNTLVSRMVKRVK